MSVYRRPARKRRGAATGPSRDFYLGKSLSAHLLSWLGSDIHRIPRSILRDGSPEQLRAIFGGLMEGDGTATARGWRAFYPGKNEGLADDFQELCIRLGVSCCKKFVPQTGQFVVLLSTRRHHYVRRPGRIEDYTGIVWDITVPTGAFVARRRGKVFVTGNCPEKGSGEAVSSGAVIDLATRGRKRGFCAVLATQRIAKLHKDAAAECNNKLIGRTGLDVDIKRAASELGFGRERWTDMRELGPGEFFAYGPALSRAVTSVRIGTVATTHPKAGARLTYAAPPPTAKVRALLPKLADLPAEAEQRVRTEAELRKDRARVERELAAAKRAQPAPTAAPERVEVSVLTDADRKKLVDLAITLQQSVELVAERVRAKLDAALEPFRRQVGTLDGKLAPILEKVAKAQPARGDLFQPGRAPLSRRAMPTPTAARAASNGHGTPATLGTGGDRRMLIALAQHGAMNDSRLSLLTGIARRGGTFRTYLGKLKTAGYVVGTADARTITDDGLVALGAYEPLPVGPALRDYWRRELGEGGMRSMFEALERVYPGPLSARDLADATGIAESGGTFRTYLGKLRTLELVVGDRSGFLLAESLFV